MTETIAIVAAIAAGTAVAACAALALLLWRARNPGRPAEMVMAELAQQQSEAVARLQGMIVALQQSQSHLQKAVNDRLDSVSHRLGDSLQKTTQQTTDNLQKLNERLAVIDGAQKNITELATQVTALQSVLSNKQERGAFGQGRMELIVRDGLPKDCYAFQHTLTNRTRPDCVVFLPDKRPLVIDAKFPLEAVTAYRDARTEDERRAAAARVRADVTRHVNDIADKYLIPGETQDLAFMFVPSDSLYSELYDGFGDIVQKAFRAKVVIVSPTHLMLAIHIIQQIQKDARMREAAGQIQAEVGRLIDDVTRMHERVLRLQQHFTQTNEDVRQIVISAEKVEKRGVRITEVEFAEEEAAADVLAVPAARTLDTRSKLEAGK